MEVPEEKFDKACKIVMIGINPMITKLKQMAETHGRISVYKFVDNVVNNKQTKEKNSHG